MFTLLPLLSKVSEAGGVDKDWIVSYVLANACCGAKRHHILFHAIERTFFIHLSLLRNSQGLCPSGKFSLRYIRGLEAGALSDGICHTRT